MRFCVYGSTVPRSNSMTLPAAGMSSCADTITITGYGIGTDVLRSIPILKGGGPSA